MSPSDFSWWLHGWSEINGGGAPTAQQWQIINDHLDLVFNKVTPDRRPLVQSVPDAHERGFVYTGAPAIGRTQSFYPTQFGYLPSGDPMQSGCGIAPFVPRTGGIMSFTIPSGIAISGWTEYEASQNRDEVFITVSRAPMYDTHASYSFYPYNRTNWQDRAFDDPITKSLLTGLGIQPVSDKVYLVVDNTLSPTKETYAYNMRGSSDHLTMLPDKGPGIINVGVGSPLIC